MNVYVDPLLNHGWKLGPSCHMHALPGHLAELHEMADIIGLKRVWFQDHEAMPHYDLTESKRNLAVRNGAIEITLRQTVEHMAAWREERRLAARDLFNL